MNAACTGARRQRRETTSHAEGPAGESGDAVRAPKRASLVRADVHPITNVR